MSTDEENIPHGQGELLRMQTRAVANDERLAKFDLMNSRAHVYALGQAGVLADTDVKTIVAALDHVEEEFEDGKFLYRPIDDELSAAIERRVIEIAGPIGAKLQTGRTRYGQMATDLRLYAKVACEQLAEGVLALQEVLLNRASGVTDVHLPGYVHLQRAQGISLAHHLLAHGWSFSRDIDRLWEARAHADVSPAEANGIGGSSFELRPDIAAEALGFARPFDNALDVLSDRDFMADALYSVAMIFVHLSRMAEELTLWTTREFGFARISGELDFRGPRPAEQIRGRAGRTVGDLAGMLATIKAIPLSFSNDLDENRDVLYHAIDEAEESLRLMAGIYETLEFDTDAMKDKSRDPVLASSDLIELMVAKGVPFREAQQTIGELMRQAEERKLPLSELIEAHPLLGDDALALLTPAASLQARKSPGGSGLDAVATQLQTLKERIGADRTRFLIAE